MKAFNKIISLLLVMAITITWIPAGTIEVRAEESDKPIISVEEKNVMVGEEIKVNVEIEDNPGILGALLEISYDERLSLVNAENGNVFSYLTMTKPGRYESPCRFNWDGQECTEDDIKDGTILTLTFEIIGELEYGVPLEINVSAPEGIIYDRNIKPLDVTTQNSSVRVYNFKAGDANNDGKVNISDIILIRRYIVSGYDVDINPNAANVNDDGRVNSADVVLLRRYITGGYGVEPIWPTTFICNHVMDQIAYTSPTCTEEGNIQYWKCNKCKKFFSDEEGNIEIKESDTILDAKGHTEVILPAVEPTSTKEGLTEGLYCSECKTVLIEQKPVPIPSLKDDEYTITYNISNSDTYLAGLEIYNPNPTKYSAKDGLLLEDLDVDGYLFKGWYTSPTEEGTRVEEIAPGSKGNKRVYARWDKVEYTVHFDSPDVPISSVKYTVDTGATLVNPSVFGYTFVGWSNNDGFIMSRIKPGTIGNMTLHANWTSNRNKAVSYSNYGKPIVIEDDKNGQFLFVYDIGRIENVPLSVVEELGNSDGISVDKTYEVIDTISEGTAKTIAETISEATTKSSGWTLSKEWNNVYSAGEESATQQIQTTERTDSEGRTVGGEYFVSNSEGGSSYMSTESGGSSATSSKVTTDTSKGLNASYDASTEMYADAKLGVENVTEVGASASFPVKIVDVDASFKNTTTIGTELTSGRKDNTAFHADASISSHVGTVDTSDNSSYFNVSANKSSNWNSTTGYKQSYNSSHDISISSAISQQVSNKTSYDMTESLGGSNSSHVEVGGTTGREEEYSTALNYSTGTSTKSEKHIKVQADAKGYYRIVEAGTVHVFGVVGYDIATASYYTYTYNVLADERHEYLDYSQDNANFDDCENGLVTFKVPFEINNYISTFTGKTGGLKFNLDGKVTGFNAQLDPKFDGTVVIPQYYSVNNGDGTYSAYKTTSFDASVFQNNKQIKKVILPAYITEIPDNAFAGCTNLESVIAYGVTHIGDNAFAGCTSDKFNFSIDNQIVSLGEHAFEGVSELKVMAANSQVADAAINSGAKKITLNISKIKECKDAAKNSYDNKHVVVTDSTDYFALISDGSSYKNLQVESSAKETFISNIKFVSNTNIPLKFNSAKVSLARVSVENAPGFAMALLNEHTELGVYGTIVLSSKGENAVISKDVTIFESNSEVTGQLKLTGNYIICDDLKNASLLTFTKTNNVPDGELIAINPSEFDSMLTTSVVTFDANGGTLSEGEESKVVYNGKIYGTLPTPQRQYFKFLGWFTKAEGGTEVTSSTIVNGTSNQTLYAHWESEEFTVSWKTAKGKTISVKRTKSPNHNAATGTLSSGDAIFYGDVLQINYSTLDGWTIDTHGKESITVTGDVTEKDIYMTVWSSWSDWSTTAVSESSSKKVETKKQYRYSDKKTTTSTNSSLSGWTQDGSSTSYGSWGSWSSWTSDPISENDTREVKTATVYGYYYFLCPKCGAHMHGWPVCYTWAGGCGSSSLSESSWHQIWSTTSWNNAGLYDFHGTGKYATDNLSGGRWFRYDGYGATKGYSYRTRSKTITYSFYKWSDWSSWSDTSYSESSTRKVESRVVYRYKTKY